MTSAPSNTVAVIGADSPIGLTVIRELGDHGLKVIAFGRSEASLGRASRHTSAFEVLRKPFIDTLPDQIIKHGIGAIFAISENDLIELAPIKDAFPDCALLVPDAAPLNLVLDKQRTLEIAESVGISAPPSWAPVAGEDFQEKAGTLTYPVAIKWSNPEEVVTILAQAGIALEKVEYADSAEELLGILARYDAIGTWPLVQYRCPGHGMAQMLHIHDGQATLRFQHQRLREWPPTGGVSSYCRSVPLASHANQMRLSETLLKAINWEGPAMVEYRHDPETGQYWLMEINGRFWGSLPLAFHCGVHFAWETYRHRVLNEASVEQIPYPARKARYLVPDTKHLLTVLVESQWTLSQKAKTALAFAVDFLNPNGRYYVWNMRDPKPLFSDLKQMAAKLVRR